MNVPRNLIAVPLAALLFTAATVAVRGQTAPIELFNPAGRQVASEAIPFADLPGDANDSWAADDFSTPAGQLWFVSSVSLEASAVAGGNGAPNPIDLTIAFDAGGVPGAAACTRQELIPAVTDEAPGTQRLTLELPAACQLCAGARYWLVLQSKDAGGIHYDWIRRTAQASSPTQWKNPGGGLGRPCAEWAPAAAVCGFGSPSVPDLSFSLFGYVSTPAYTKGDFNGDLCFDALLQRRPSHGFHADAMVWPMDGLVRTGAQLAIQPTPAANLWIVGTDDFNGDRHNDLVLRDKVTGALEFWFLRGVTRIGSAPLTGVPDPSRLPSLQLEATGDFNRDGQPDLLLRDLNTFRVEVWALGGAGVSSVLRPTPDTTGFGNWRVAGAADLNRDGNRDLVWHNVTSSHGVLWALDGNLQRLADPAASGYFLGCSRPQAPPYLWGVRGVGVNGLPDPSVPGPVTPGIAYLLWQFDPSAGLPENPAFCDPQPNVVEPDAVTAIRNSHERLIIWQGGGRPGGGGPGGLTFTDAAHLHLPGDGESEVSAEYDWWIVGPR